MIYSLICYRPDGVDTCRGCVMDRSSSDFEAIVSDNINDIIALWLKKREDEDAHKSERAYGDWETTLLLNGHCSWTNNFESRVEMDEATSEKFAEIEALLHQKNQERILGKEVARKAAEEKATLVAEQKKVAAKIAKEAAEKAEYDRLKAKFGT